MFKIKTDHPLALSSPDYHSEDSGSRKDMFTNLSFNKKVYDLFKRPVKILDLGCALGAVPQSFIQDGNKAIGIEGSDYALNNKLGYWPSDYLFTADITKPFQLFEDDNPIRFDMIMAWEVLEHLAEDEIAGLIENVKNHIELIGFFICSISTYEGGLHRTSKPQSWWLEKFMNNGLGPSMKILNYLETDFVRNCNNSFHLVLEKP